MSMTTALPAPTSRFERLRQRHAWTVAVLLVFVVLISWRATQLPMFAGFEIRTITAGALVVALLAMAQGVVLMSGGINMAVGALMVMINCLSAKYMQNASVLACVAIAVGCILAAMALSALMALVINVSHVPDIVITLAFSFTFAGSALLIIGGPGGGTNTDFKNAFVGSLSNPVPAIVVMAILLVAVWYPFSRSRTGLAMYAIGSSSQAAFLAGVNVGATRAKVYLLSGFFVGLAGVAMTAYTGGGDPHDTIGMAMLMSSVAAAVLGGVSLTGGSGGLLGPVIAAMILGLVPAILMGLGVDPNFAQVVSGAIIIAVVLFGGALQIRRRAK